MAERWASAVFVGGWSGNHRGASARTDLRLRGQILGFSDSGQLRRRKKKTTRLGAYFAPPNTTVENKNKNKNKNDNSFRP